MEFTGIDKLIFGVEDMETSRRFCEDWGLRALESDPAGPRFETLDGGEVELRPADDPDLPPAFEPGSTLRQVVWGVADENALRAVESALGSLTATDPNGMSLGFRVSSRRDAGVRGVGVNGAGHLQRVDERGPVYERAHPLGIGHVVFFTGDLAATLAFYTDRLGFRVSDYYPDAGYFLRCRAEGGHHDLFLLQTPDRKIGLNHVAYTLRDIYEIFGGGIHINSRGWQTEIGPGRHPISSAFFWYVKSPLGGLAEYYTNEDWCTADWQARAWTRGNETFADWAIAGGIDPKTRRQVVAARED